MFIKTFVITPYTDHYYEVVYVTIGNPAFLPRIIFNWRTLWGQVTVCFGHVGEQEIKCWPIRTQEIAGVRLSEKELYVMSMGSGTNNVVSISEENMLYTKN